jgi:hypothetical protein
MTYFHKLKILKFLICENILGTFNFKAKNFTDYNKILSSENFIYDQGECKKNLNQIGRSLFAEYFF